MTQPLSTRNAPWTANLEDESVTGDQARSYRLRRGAKRDPIWKQVEEWRGRWTEQKVTDALNLLASRASPEEFASKTGFPSLSISGIGGFSEVKPDLRGLDIILIPPPKRKRIGAKLANAKPPLDLSYAQLQGARLTRLNMSGANFSRACLQKATLRGTALRGAILGKAHLEDADLRDCDLDNANLGFVRYTEDAFWSRGTVLMEANLQRAIQVNPLLDRCAREQAYLYSLKYSIQHSYACRLLYYCWWITSNFGKSFSLWAAWSAVWILLFAGLFCFLGIEESFHVEHLQNNFLTMLYYSVVTFTTLGFGDVVPITKTAACCVMGEVVIGYLWLGGLISILATKIARKY